MELLKPTVEHIPTGSSAGGALVYISDRFSYQPRSDITNRMYSPKVLESVFVEISFSHKANFIVGCIYKHPFININTFNNDVILYFNIFTVSLVIFCI